MKVLFFKPWFPPAVFLREGLLINVELLSCVPFLVAQLVKNPPAMQVTPFGSLGQEASPGEGDGHPLRYSGLENPMDRGAWWAAVQRGSQKRLSVENTFKNLCVWGVFLGGEALEDIQPDPRGLVGIQGAWWAGPGSGFLFLSFLP